MNLSDITSQLESRYQDWGRTMQPFLDTVSEDPVVANRIVRFIEEGDSPLEAALKGSEQIGFTIVSLTISLIAVLIPLLFMGDVVGRLRLHITGDRIEHVRTVDEFPFALPIDKAETALAGEIRNTRRRRQMKVGQVSQYKHCAPYRRSFVPTIADTR